MPNPSKKGEKQHPIKAILSGGISGGIEICITYPTEYVKTQLQLQSRTNPVYNGIIDCVKKTVQRHGVLGLYTGLSPLFWMSIPKVAIRFGGYAVCSNFLSDKDGKLSGGRTFMAGLGAGALEAIFAVCPMETVKTKFVDDQRRANPRFKNFYHGTKLIIQEQGLGGIYKGLTPTIFKQATNQGIRFLVFGKVKQYMLRDKPQGTELTVPQSLLAGAIAGFASVMGNTPLDVIKTKMQGLDAVEKYNGSNWACIKDIYRQYGLKGFYHGTIPRLSRVCLDVAIVMTLFEKIVKVLDYLWPTPGYEKKL